MNYKITHITTYKYSTPVSVCHNVVILAPQANDYLQVSSHRLTIRPAPERVSKRQDMFGNTVQRFSLEQNHAQLTISAISRVNVLPRQIPSAESAPTCAHVMANIADRTDPNWLQMVPMMLDSHRIRRSPEYLTYAADSLHHEKSAVAAVTDLTHQIFTEFKYDKNATKVDTPTKVAFNGRHGVCQDFAHIAISCLRSFGLPARYVSGYLRTVPPPGKERMIGADQSHAWLSVYCGPDIGWLDFDPTNDCVCATDHIPIAVGRDYSDVVPIRGVFLGGGEPQLSVSVDVAPED